MWAEKHVNKSATSRTKPKSTGRKLPAGLAVGIGGGRSPYGKFCEACRERKRRSCENMNHFWDGLTLGVIMGIVFVFAGFWFLDMTTRGEEWRQEEERKERER